MDVLWLRKWAVQVGCSSRRSSSPASTAAAPVPRLRRPAARWSSMLTLRARPHRAYGPCAAKSSAHIDRASRRRLPYGGLGGVHEPDGPPPVLRRAGPRRQRSPEEGPLELYLRGLGAMRGRIEAELAPAERRSVARPELEIDTAMVRLEVVRLRLARVALPGRGPAITPRERTAGDSPSDASPDAAGAFAATTSSGAEAMEKLIGPRCELRYFATSPEDPVEAARLSCPTAVALLWLKVRDHIGFPAFPSVLCPARQMGVALRVNRTGSVRIRQKEQSWSPLSPRCSP